MLTHALCLCVLILFVSLGKFCSALLPPLGHNGVQQEFTPKAMILATRRTGTRLFPHQSTRSTRTRIRLHMVKSTATPSSSNSWVKGFFNHPSAAEVGIQTAQLLLDSKRQTQVKQQLKQDFPLVPGAVIDACLDLTSQAFSTIAPKKLQLALQPGGMVKVRPELQSAIVDSALKQQMIQAFPLLNREDKAKLLESVVGVTLDYLLQDAQALLEAPEIRLEALELQLKQVKQRMGFARLFKYRLTQNPGKVAGIMLAFIGMVGLYQQRHTPFVQGVATVTYSVVCKTATIVGQVATIAKRAIQGIHVKLGGILGCRGFSKVKRSQMKRFRK
jgi:hypothetical protein